MFNKILIANRGEIACRIIRACEKLDITPVIIYSDADKNFGYVQKYLKLGLAYRLSDLGNSNSSQVSKTYLNQDKILEIAEVSGCQALHPGYGFLSENAPFAKRCEMQKLKFIGPSAVHILQMGDKANARESMKNLGLPVMPGSDGEIINLEQAQNICEQIGYPVILKASAGGGGKGMRLVKKAAELEENYNMASAESLSAFGDSKLYIEKFFTKARHIEFQILGDNYGNITCLPERECSIQRKHQKLIEESPANFVSQKIKTDLIQKIKSALEKIKYENAGTVEFLVDDKDNFYFMEMNTRLQVEHPVTEMTTGLDLVEWQIRIACGQKIDNLKIALCVDKHAIEFRINAEDIGDNFRPCPGVVKKIEFPETPDLVRGDGCVRIETHLENNTEISSFYDSMIAKVIVSANDRKSCLKLAQEALGKIKLESDQIKTTLELHQKILESKEFQSGKYFTSFVEENILCPS